MANMLSPEELVDGYRLNRASFRDVHVAWKRTETAEIGEIMGLEKSAAGFRELARNRDLPAHERKQWLQLAEDKLKLRKTYQQQPSRSSRMEFWTNRTDFQVRFPILKHVADDSASGSGWRFPRDSLTPTTLLESFRDVEVWSYNSHVESGQLRHWSGVNKRGGYEGYITSKRITQVYSNFQFPPLLGLAAGSSASSYWNRIDQFFDLPVHEMKVIGKDRVGGRELHILRHMKVSDVDPGSKGFQSPPDPNLMAAVFTDCWIDVARGCLPLRMVSLGDWLVGERKFLCEPLRKPHRSLDVLAIAKVPDAGYYPMKGAATDYVFFPTSHALHPLARALAGENIYENHFKGRTDSWDVIDITANSDIPAEVFALEFPKGTWCYDADHSRRFVQGRENEDYETLLRRANRRRIFCWR